MENHPCDTWVIVPAYNEEKTIGTVLDDLIQYGYSVVVVDDGSSDGTRKTALQHPVTVLSHAINLGQGAALQTGLSYVLQYTHAKYVVTFDSDGQHRAIDIGRMLTCCQDGNWQVVLGSRFISGGHTENISFLKKAVLRLAILFTRAGTGLTLTDTHNGLRLFTREAAEKIKITHNGMAHASEIIAQIAAYRLRYCEAPVTITYTDYSVRKGQSVWNGINILWDLWVNKIR